MKYGMLEAEDFETETPCGVDDGVVYGRSDAGNYAVARSTECGLDATWCAYEVAGDHYHLISYDEIPEDDWGRLEVLERRMEQREQRKYTLSFLDPERGWTWAAVTWGASLGEARKNLAGNIAGCAGHKIRIRRAAK